MIKWSKIDKNILIEIFYWYCPCQQILYWLSIIATRKKTCPPSVLHVSVAKTSLKVTARVQVRQAEDWYIVCRWGPLDRDWWAAVQLRPELVLFIIHSINNVAFITLTKMNLGFVDFFFCYGHFLHINWTIETDWSIMNRVY